MTNKEIHKICLKYDIENYTIRDGVVDVDGNVYLAYNKLEKIPLDFGVVNGFFDCSVNELTTLEGSPYEVGGFYCNNNKLVSLYGAPLKVNRNFYCYNNTKELSYEKYLKNIKRSKKIKEVYGK